MHEPVSIENLQHGRVGFGVSGITATVICDSSHGRGDYHRLTTMIWRYPRFIHSEIMTHRAFSKSAASSRAIPAKRMMEQVENDPAMPLWWGKNQPGMQAREELGLMEREGAKRAWLAARLEAIRTVEALQVYGLHKQVANRILEPWMWMQVVITGAHWDNFFSLRCHPDAQPEFQALAFCALNAMNASIPRRLEPGEWHTPFVSEQEVVEFGQQTAMKASVARCARVSYLNHDGTDPDINKDVELHDKLMTSGHMSPFEHQAHARNPLTHPPEICGNFFNEKEGGHWAQYRKYIANECVRRFDGLRR